MRPEGIVKAVQEVLSEILNSSRPANEILNAYTRSRRYIGAKDRKQIAEQVWSYIRHRRRLDYLYPNTSTAAKLSFLKLGLPDPLPADMPLPVQWEVPDWLVDKIEHPEMELPALLMSPPIVLRANGDRDKIQQYLSEEGLETDKTKLSPLGLILKKRVSLNTSESYRQGLVEIQDEGSQLVALETHIQPDERVLDYCAGAGGKSLIFAQMMHNKGEIIAHDISKRRLAELEKRALRAGARVIHTKSPLASEDEGAFTHVVVDAPCSGVGTWRRCPDARWKLTMEQLNQLLKTQADILDKAVAYVAFGGRLSYMTCSLLACENTDQVVAFLKRHPDFSLLRQRQFSPALSGTDGLFVAVLERTSSKKT